MSKTSTWKIFVNDEPYEYYEPFSSYEEAEQLLTEIVLENVLNIVLNCFPEDVVVGENLEDILCTLDSCSDEFKDWEIRKVTFEVDDSRMEELRKGWYDQLKSDFQNWSQEERDQKEAEERALLAKLKAKYE